MIIATLILAEKINNFKIGAIIFIIFGVIAIAQGDEGGQ